MSRSRLVPMLACTTLLLATGAAATPARAASGAKVLICHHAGPTKQIEINVDGSAVEAHVANHGDSVGACGGTPT